MNVLVFRKYTLKCEVFRRKMTLESALDYKEIKPISPKGNQLWIVIGRTDAEAEDPTLWAPDVKSWLTRKDPAWFWGRLKIGGGNRRWDCWMASLTQWTWVWANSRRQWRTGNYGMLRSMGSQRVGHDWVTEWNGRRVCILCSWGDVCYVWGFPGGTSGKVLACQCKIYKRLGFHPWVRKIP